MVSSGYVSIAARSLVDSWKGRVSLFSLLSQHSPPLLRPPNPIPQISIPPPPSPTRNSLPFPLPRKIHAFVLGPSLLPSFSGSAVQSMVVLCFMANIHLKVSAYNVSLFWLWDTSLKMSFFFFLPSFIHLPSRRFLWKAQFLGGCCFNSLIAKDRGTRVSLECIPSSQEGQLLHPCFQVLWDTQYSEDGAMEHVHLTTYQQSFHLVPQISTQMSPTRISYLLMERQSCFLSLHSNFIQTSIMLLVMAK